MDLIETIYEAALVPELWPRALDDLSAASDSLGATIFVFDETGEARGQSVDGFRPMLDEFLASEPLRMSTSVLRMCGVKPNSFIDVDSYMSPAEIEADPARIRLRASGVGANLCTAVPMPGGQLALYVMNRRLGDGGYPADAVAALNGLRPHLARAAMLAVRLGLERALGAVAAMERLGYPAAVLTRRRVVATNDLFEAASPIVRVGAQGRVSLSAEPADALLQAALSDETGSRGPEIRSIPVAATEASPPVVVHALPIRRSAHDVFFGGDTLLVLTEVKASAILPAPSILSGLFDLPPAEAKLAASLVGGQSLKSAAATSAIRLSTARSYLEHIFRKTGTKQQSQLVALLKSAAVSRRKPG